MVPSISEHWTAVASQCHKSNFIAGMFRGGIRECTKVAIFYIINLMSSF